jgi:mRNA interferase RelE/StbE
MHERAPWQLVISRQSAKTLRKLPRDLRERIDRAILALSVDPGPAGCKKLTGYTDLYRVRVGGLAHNLRHKGR